MSRASGSPPNIPRLGVIGHRQSVAILESAEDRQAMSNGLTIQRGGSAGLAVLILLGFSAAAAGADANPTNNPPSPIPLPQAKVTIPPIVRLKLQAGGDLTVLDQVKKFEGVGGMPVMFVVTLNDASNDLAPWSLITPAHVRMFNINGTANPEVSDHLTHARNLKQAAYALEIPPKAVGQQPLVVVWENERDGALNQPTLEAIYRRVGIAVDPLTSPSLDAATFANFRQAATRPDAPTKLIFLAFHSGGIDPDVVSATRLRILMGVEFIKSPKTPVMELDEDRNPALAAQLVPSTASVSPILVVYNLISQKVEAIYDPTKLPELTEDAFQAFATKNGATPFINSRTDVAEAFIVIVDRLRQKNQQGANDSGTERKPVP